MSKVLKSTCRKLSCKKSTSSNFFYEVLQRHNKLEILVNLRMLDHSHQKSQYQFVGNFHTYLHPKNQLQICKLLIFDTLAMPSYAHPKWYY